MLLCRSSPQHQSGAMLSPGCVGDFHAGGPVCLTLLAHCALDLIQDRLLGEKPAQCTERGMSNWCDTTSHEA